MHIHESTPAATVTTVDLLADLLSGARAHGGILNQTIVDPPWSIRIADRAPLTLVTLLRGDAWIAHADTAPTHLLSGDIAIVRGPAPYVVADDPGTTPFFTIMPNGQCVADDGSDLHLDLALDVRTHGPSSAGSVAILSGTYQISGNVSHRLLTVLPQLLVVAAPETGNAVVSLLREELLRDVPGQQAVLDRLLDLALLVAHGPFGLAERARALLVSLWLLGVAAFLCRRVRPSRLDPDRLAAPWSAADPRSQG